MKSEKFSNNVRYLALSRDFGFFWMAIFRSPYLWADGITTEALRH